MHYYHRDGLRTAISALLPGRAARASLPGFFITRGRY